MKTLFPALLLVPLLLMLPADLIAQGFGDEENLYIPPALTVSTPHDSDKPTIRITESHSPQWSALIPALFFDHPGDWSVPERYRLFGSAAETSGYADTSGVETGAGERAKYYEILNVLGYRLMRHPDVVLRLRGCYSFEGGETPEVARERALVVREYLVNVWDIDTTRLLLLPTTRPADTLSSNPIQAEARRVEFVDTTGALLAPVRYREVGIAGEAVPLRIIVRPNMAAEKVDSIEIMMLDDRGEVQDAKKIAGHPDSTTYAISAFWKQEKSRGEDGMTLVCRVYDTDGKIRPSNKIFLPVRVVPQEEQNLRVDHQFVTVPFHSLGESDPGPAEKSTAMDAVSFFEERIEPKHREGYILYGWGGVDLAEHPSLNFVEVNVRYADNSQEEEKKSEFAPAGKLSIMQMIMIERNGTIMRAYVPGGSHEEQEEKARRFREEQMEHRYQLAETPSFADADSLARRRAERLITWMRDSLEVPMINAELPEKIGRLTTPFGADPDDREVFERDVAEGTSAMREGVRYSGREGTEVFARPEDRWYARGVRLEFWTEEYLQWRLMMSGIE